VGGTSTYVAAGTASVSVSASSTLTADAPTYFGTVTYGQSWAAISAGNLVIQKGFYAVAVRCVLSGSPTSGALRLDAGLDVLMYGGYSRVPFALIGNTGTTHLAVVFTDSRVRPTLRNDTNASITAQNFGVQITRLGNLT
jgi:hypothetical protein